jgi:hypothetical protein
MGAGVATSGLSILLVDQVLALEHDGVVATENILDERVLGTLHALEVVIAGPVVLRERLRRPVRLRGGGRVGVGIGLRQAGDARRCDRSDSERDDGLLIVGHLECCQRYKQRMCGWRCNLAERKALMVFVSVASWSGSAATFVL